ncbi:MAG: hypothetical protein WBD31_23580 [Rubripirellula sp.]
MAVPLAVATPAAKHHHAAARRHRLAVAPQNQLAAPKPLAVDADHLAASAVADCYQSSAAMTAVAQNLLVAAKHLLADVQWKLRLAVARLNLPAVRTPADAEVRAVAC